MPGEIGRGKNPALFGVWHFMSFCLPTLAAQCNYIWEWSLCDVKVMGRNVVFSHVIFLLVDFPDLKQTFSFGSLQGINLLTCHPQMALCIML